MIDVKVGDWVTLTKYHPAYRVMGVTGETVRLEGFVDLQPLHKITEVIRPAPPPRKRKVKASELMAWLERQRSWYYTVDFAADSERWCFVMIGSRDASEKQCAHGPTIAAAIISLRKALRKRGIKVEPLGRVA